MARSKDNKDKPIIIIKRPNVSQEEDHGGTWKIAYADFVTAMMAFFLLMWLLGSSSQGDLKGISEYFRNPLKVTLLGGPSSGNSSSVIPGGGTNFEETYGQEQKGDTDQKRIRMAAERALASAKKIKENESLGSIQSKLLQQIEEDPGLKNIKSQIKMTITNEGLEIQIVDEENKPMFKVGQAVPMPHLMEILKTLSSVISNVPNKISITGHTDSSPFVSTRGYTNWELSADRANASRAALVAFGLPADKVLKVSGLADVVPIDKDPTAPQNRRISIVLLNAKAEAEILGRDPEPEESVSGPVVSIPENKVGEKAFPSPVESTPLTRAAKPPTNSEKKAKPAGSFERPWQN